MVKFEPPSSPLLKIHDAAAYIQMSVSWMKQNPAAIPHVRIGRSKRWLRRDLDTYIELNTRNAQAQSRGC